MLIYLHGPTSSGKTSIALELQEMLDCTALHFALDTIFQAIPRTVATRIMRGDDLSDVQCPSIGRSYLDCVKALAALGHHLIIDDNLADDVVTEHMRDIIAQPSAVLVGVVCPLAELTRREAQRKDRPPGSAARDFQVIHTRMRYDLTVDTSRESPKEAAARIATFVQQGQTARSTRQQVSPRC